MLHTPRLCIDTRLSRSWGTAGLQVGQFVDELAAYHGEEESPWVNRHRTVLLSNKGQIFSGPWKRHNTRVAPGTGPFSSYWERRFVNEAPVTFVHRFRPFGFALEKPTKPTLTTWLPSHRLPLFPKFAGGAWEQHVVPSKKDKSWFLAHTEQVKPESVHVVVPSPRRFVFFSEIKKAETPNLLIWVSEDFSQATAKAVDFWREAKPGREVARVSISDLKAASPQKWLELLSKAELMIYEVSRPLDSGLLAWEALAWNIPVVFSDEHGALSEWDNSPLWSLSEFQLSPQNFSIPNYTTAAQARLSELPLPKPNEGGRAYTAVYRSVFG